MANMDATAVPTKPKAQSPVLTPENFAEGFLIDETWMAGVTATESGYLAYVVDHDSGESLLSVELPSLERALGLVNSVSRGWAYEKASPCGECGPGGCTRGESAGTGTPGGCKKCKIS